MATVTPIDDELKRFLESGLVVLVATRNDALHPFVTRGWGVLVHDEDRLRLSVSVPRASSARTLADLAANGRIAVSLGDQASFRAVQIKGRGAAVVDTDASALERATEQFTRFAEKAAQLGVPPHLAQVLFTTDLVSIAVVADEIFDQTPGPSAGKKVA
jgi:hypothetical protein